MLGLLTLMIFIGACSKSGGFKKTKSGLLYKIISTGQGPLAKKGEFLKVHYTQKINYTQKGRDSILSTSVNGLPTYAGVDSVGPVYNPVEIFGMLRKGDSAIIVMAADSLLKKQGQLPPFIGKKDKLMLILKVVDIFPNEEVLRKDQQSLLDDKKQGEIKEIEKYLAEKNIKATKTEKGTFVEIINQGDGPKVDTGKAVHVKYKGQTFAGKVFDTNMDTTFGHGDPYVLVIGKRGAIEGWDDGLRLFNKGGKGRLYIPSILAYGPNPPQGAPFKAFENLMFDVEIVDVTVPEPPKPRMPMMPRPNGPKPGPAQPSGAKPAK